jgi:ribosome-associated translation inhibitor RaiA
MIQIIFKNLEKSDLIHNIAYERIEKLFTKFPQLKQQKVSCTLAMNNSRTQLGPDEYVVKVQTFDGHYKNISLERKSMSLHKSLAEVINNMHERLKRHDEKRRRTHRVLNKKNKEFTQLDISPLPMLSDEFESDAS